MKFSSFLAISLASLAIFTSCGVTKVTPSEQNKLLYESIIRTCNPTLRAPKYTFSNLNHGVQTSVTPISPVKKELYTLDFSNEALYVNALTDYVRSMGFKERFYDKDFKLSITIKKLDLDLSYKSCCCELYVCLKNSMGEELYRQDNILSRFSMNAYTDSKLNRIVTEAFNLALEQVDWNRIASFLRVEQLPVNEPQKQVRGLGDTALEQTIIRWDVQSRPQGADLFWRVVSKTPEVKSTNNKYLNTAPYEATKTLDIRGLTYQTAGNVRIILRCEKEGYLPQEKEYDVRMILDQEEISAFFRLVEDK